MNVLQAEKLLASTEDIQKCYDGLTVLLSYPENAADKTYYKHLSVKRAKISALVKYREELCGLLQEVKTLDGVSDELEKALNRAADKLSAELIKLGDDGTPAAEIEIIGDASCASALLSVLRTFAAANGAKFVGWTDKTAEIEGVGAYAELKKLAGLHVFRGKPSGEVRLFVFPHVHRSRFDENDVKLDVFHSDGAGGQNVNKVETAVRATHIPTGATVTCRDERSQLMNKRRALERLKQKVETAEEKEFNSRRAKEKKAQLSFPVAATYTDGRKDL